MATKVPDNKIEKKRDNFDYDKWLDYDVGTLKIILEEAQKYTDTSLIIFDANKKRVRDFFQYLLPVIGGLILLGSSIPYPNKSQKLTILLAIIVALVLLIYNTLIYWAADIKGHGWSPKNYGKNTHNYLKTNDEHKEKRVYILFIEHYQKKYTHNMTVNKIKADHIKVLTISAIVFGIIFIALFLYSFA